MTPRERYSGPPLLPGEIDDPAAAVDVARERFWSAIPAAESSRRAFVALRDDVLPAYRAAAERALGWRLPAGRLADGSPERRDAMNAAWGLIVADLPAVRRWAKKWRLSAPWCFDRIESTLIRWLLEPDDAAELRPTPTARLQVIGGALKTAPDPVQAFAGIGAWVPSVETWAAYQAAALRAVQGYLRQYRAEAVARWAAPRGGELPGRPADRYSAEHFLWAARVLVGGESCYAVAKTDRGLRVDVVATRKRPVGDSSVRLRVKRVAELIGLP